MTAPPVSPLAPATLTTARLFLRPWRESDAESLYRYASDPQVGPIAGWPVHTSVADSLSVIRGVLSAPQTFAVCLRGEDTAIGSIGLLIGKESNIPGLGDDEAEIGYWVGVPFWGQGLIPEGVRRLMEYAFAELGMKKMWCGYFDGNIRSKKVQEKCGFRYHHTRTVPWPLMGDIRTEHITCITLEEWEKGSESAR